MAHFLQSLRLTNLLSFGPEGETVEFGPLNVLIGPNSTGKSNLIDAIDLLRSTARELNRPFRLDGMSNWVWHGKEPLDHVALDAEVMADWTPFPLVHSLSLENRDENALVGDESIWLGSAASAPSHGPQMHYENVGGDATITEVHAGDVDRNGFADLDRRQSILAQYRHPGSGNALGYLAKSYERIAIYRDWSVGRRAAHRRRQDTNLDASRLTEDMSNLAMVLNGLAHDVGVRREIAKRLRELLPAFDDYITTAIGGTIQVFFTEAHLGTPVPATRLSDGALRFLALLCILCHPDPPPLVCIEEPEVGLHPDAINLVGQLLVEASERMQLIVTTHSPTLLSALRAEDVLVSSLDERGTHLSRLLSGDLAQWLKDYSLGDLWLMGVLGGNRY